MGSNISKLWAARIATTLAVGLSVLAGTVQGQGFPTKQITIVVPTAAGGANDAMARLVAQGLSQRLGKPVIVENKAGANGAIASEYVAQAAPDGHVILFGYIATHAINPALQKLRYDPVADFEPIGLVAASPTLLVVNNNVKAKNMQELVALMKAKPGSFSYASAGNGTAPHFAAELLKLSTGVDMLHVPYKGSAPAIMDTIGGTTQVMLPSLFTAYPQVKGGKLKALGLVGDKRSAVMPDVPTLAEQGVKNVSMSQWYGLFAPAKTP
ncbi:MAG TPA: tripartite tricarboxylate transporter substrate binding protein, partial [Casimicrobium sp.]|nr:tripartite tricarboxylate transporter substrate binding protein [Casimicrobium sp.]